MIVPSSTGFELLQQASPRRRKALATQWTPPGSSCSGLASEVCRNLQNNYLLGGGGRAVDRQREDALTRMNAAAIKDLRRANAALAGELSRCKLEAEEEKRSLETAHADDKKQLAAEREHAASLAERAAGLEEHRDATKSKARAKVKELEKRLRQEHEARCRSETDLEASGHSLASLQQQHDDTKQRAACTASEKQKLQEKVVSLEHQLHALRLENGNLAECIRHSDTGQASASDECNRLQQKVADMERQLQSAKEAYQEAKAKHPKLQAGIHELEAACRKRGAHLEATLAEMRGHQDQAADFSAAHEDLTHQLKRSQERAERLAWDGKLASEQDVTDARLRDIQDALHTSQMAAAAAAEEVMGLQGKHAHSLAQLSACNKELSEYKMQSQELTEGLHSATEQLAALQAVQGADRRQLESRLALVSHELEQTKAELSRCQYGKRLRLSLQPLSKHNA
ncbi:hypothetical protein WJX84_003002 [Apatococcus fuscideae]|uniref:Uncharacterized protein n=1 Tax=Apatococcus fuscideae TaxID=2026836 RepID=A0AAW1SUB1_9CHLO